MYPQQEQNIATEKIMKKLMALLCLSPLTAFAAPAEFDIQKLLKPVSKSILAEGPEASSWCDGILTPILA
ncbi:MULTISPECIES: hypothetical protein [unclassified Pseudoalteromonas]|uniref:hypothetical protein n=1 Tax=unclassified Pseudoalteromonas TaxID=194690 RepID=UPI0005AB4840|nr:MULTISPECIES: hypothetical protein [unclassified Pseudoalteromonas]